MCFIIFVPVQVPSTKLNVDKKEHIKLLLLNNIVIKGRDSQSPIDLI